MSKRPKEAKEGPKFEFISVSGSALRGDAEARRRVRSHAQADYRRRTRSQPQPQPALQVELDASSLVGRTQQAAGPAQSSALVPLVRRGAGLPDIPQALAETGDQRSRLLWDHLYDGTCVVFKSMLAVGFMDLIQESTALTQMLSTSAWHMNNTGEKTKENSTDYAKYSVVATRSLRQKIASSATRASLEVVVAVLAFAAYSNLISDPQLISIHLDGLTHVLGHRGGLGSLESVPAVRMMIYWIDVSGAYLRDEPPRYPQPFELLSLRSRLRLDKSPINRLPATFDLSQDPAVARVCATIRQANDIIDADFSRRGDETWANILFAGYHLAPVLYDLLSMARGTINDDIESRRRECFRLAAIIYVTELRSRFGVDPSPSTVYVTKLQAMLNSADLLQMWPSSSDIFLLWSLAVAASSPCVAESARTEFARTLSDCRAAAGLGSYGSFTDQASGLMRSDGTAGESLYPPWNTTYIRTIEHNFASQCHS